MRQKLILTTTSLHNVVIANASDVIYYEVVTPKWAKHLTKVSRLDPNTRQFDLVGELQNEDDRPVMMRLYGEAFRSTSEFLREEEVQEEAVRVDLEVGLEEGEGQAGTSGTEK